MIVGKRQFQSRLRRYKEASLALDMHPDAITLFERATDGEWTQISQAKLDSASFAKEIDELRVEAKIRQKGSSCVALWLPKEQVLVRQYILEERGAGAYAEAGKRLAAETQYAFKDLSIALGSAAKGEPVPVLAAHTQTIIESKEYARQWGFLNTVVSTRVGAELIRDRLPEFRLPDARTQRAARKTLRAGAAVMAAAAVGAVIYLSITTVEPLLDLSEPAEALGPQFSMAIVIDEQPALHPAHLGLVKVGHPQGLALQRTRVAQKHDLGTQDLDRYGPAPVAVAPELFMDRAGEPRMRVGAAAALPSISSPGRLATAQSVHNGMKEKLERLSASIDLIRHSSIGPSQQTDEVQTASDLATTSVASSEPPVIAPVTTNQQAQEVLASASDAVDAPLSDEELLTPTRFAPVEMANVPNPRPEAELEEVATQEQTQPARPSEAELVSPDTADVEPPSDAPTEFAALAAPEPKIRPRVPAIEQAAAAAQNVSQTRTFAPRSVRNAANEVGLALKETSLIGVIDAGASRQALVRLPGGDYRKVGRGDDLQGWRVKSITREAMRLSKQGQSRTLLLVSR